MCLKMDFKKLASEAGTLFGRAKQVRSWFEGLDFVDCLRSTTASNYHFYADSKYVKRSVSQQKRAENDK